MTSAIRTFLSRPNWVPRHIDGHLDKLYVKMAELGFGAQTIGKNVTSLASPFEEVVGLMKSCECTVVLGLPQIRVSAGTVKAKEIETGFSLPTEWNQIEAAISIMLGKPTLMMLHRGVAARGLFERGAANVFVYEFHTLGPKWVEDTVPRLLALRQKVEAARH
jgi:hypothetical protein